MIPKDLIINQKEKLPRTDTWNEYIKYAFILSPSGNGYDCHRTYEALCLGCIPIIKTGSLDILFVDLPVLIVSNFNVITEELLVNTINEFKCKKFNYDKLTLNY